MGRLRKRKRLDPEQDMPVEPDVEPELPASSADYLPDADSETSNDEPDDDFDDDEPDDAKPSPAPATPAQRSSPKRTVRSGPKHQCTIRSTVRGATGDASGAQRRHRSSHAASFSQDDDDLPLQQPGSMGGQVSERILRLRRRLTSQGRSALEDDDHDDDGSTSNWGDDLPMPQRAQQSSRPPLQRRLGAAAAPPTASGPLSAGRKRPRTKLGLVQRSANAHSDARGLEPAPSTAPLEQRGAGMKARARPAEPALPSPDRGNDDPLQLGLPTRQTPARQARARSQRGGDSSEDDFPDLDSAGGTAADGAGAQKVPSDTESSDDDLPLRARYLERRRARQSPSPQPQRERLGGWEIIEIYSDDEEGPLQQQQSAGRAPPKQPRIDRSAAAVSTAPRTPSGPPVPPSGERAVPAAEDRPEPQGVLARLAAALDNVGADSDIVDLTRDQGSDLDSEGGPPTPPAARRRARSHDAPARRGAHRDAATTSGSSRKHPVLDDDDGDDGAAGGAAAVMAPHTPPRLAAGRAPLIVKRPVRQGAGVGGEDDDDFDDYTRNGAVPTPGLPLPVAAQATPPRALRRSDAVKAPATPSPVRPALLSTPRARAVVAPPARRSERTPRRRAADVVLDEMRDRKAGRKAGARRADPYSPDSSPSPRADTASRPQRHPLQCQTEDDVTNLQRQALTVLYFKGTSRTTAKPTFKSSGCALCGIRIKPGVHEISKHESSAANRHEENRRADGKPFGWAHITCKRGPQFWAVKSGKRDTDLPPDVGRLLDEPRVDLGPEDMLFDESDDDDSFVVDDDEEPRVGGDDGEIGDDGDDADGGDAAAASGPQRQQGRLQRRSGGADVAGPSAAPAQDPDDLDDEEARPRLELVSTRRLGKVFFAGGVNKFDLLFDAGLQEMEAKDLLERCRRFQRFACETVERDLQITSSVFVNICRTLTSEEWPREARRVKAREGVLFGSANKAWWREQLEECVVLDYTTHAVEVFLEEGRNRITTQAFTASYGPMMMDMLTKPFFSIDAIHEYQLQEKASAEAEVFDEQHTALQDALENVDNWLSDAYKPRCPLCKRQCHAFRDDGCDRAVVAVSFKGPRCPLDGASQAAQPTAGAAGAYEVAAAGGHGVEKDTRFIKEDDESSSESEASGNGVSSDGLGLDHSASDGEQAEECLPDWAVLCMDGIHALREFACKDTLHFEVGETEDVQRHWLLGSTCRLKLHAVHLYHHFVWRAALRLRASLISKHVSSHAACEAQISSWQTECLRSHEGVMYELYFALFCLQVVSHTTFLGGTGATTVIEGLLDEQEAFCLQPELFLRLPPFEHTVQWVSEVLDLVEALLGADNALSTLDASWSDAWYLPCIPVS